jgi:SAM-dependent methyltransferase
VEIGALHLPLPLPAGASATHVDRFSHEELRAAHPELDGFEIVETDVVDDGEHLAAFADGSQDFVIANHFIEHCEDPVAAIGNQLRVLRPGGHVFMAVPERRRSFDRSRPPTSIEHVLRDNAEGPQVSRSQHYEEWVRLVERVPPEWIAARAERAEQTGQRIHFHVWGRTDFEEMLEVLRVERGLPLRVERVQPNLSEFVAIFSRI